MHLIKYLYEILASKKYTHVDKEIGVLRRVGGYWRVESPRETLGVSVKIFGSDRFGPNSKALISYKDYRDKFDLVWKDAVEVIKQKLEKESLSWYKSKTEFV